MQPPFRLVRTTTGDKHFRYLVCLLDHELWNELNEDQATYDQHNKVPGIETAVVVFENDLPVACGCFKPFDEKTVEVKRMFVQKQHRGLGLSKKVLTELERWATSLGYSHAVLETSVHFAAAKQLYLGSGYEVVPNYPPYEGLDESVCMKKCLNSNP